MLENIICLWNLLKNFLLGYTRMQTSSKSIQLDMGLKSQIFPPNSSSDEKNSVTNSVVIEKTEPIVMANDLDKDIFAEIFEDQKSSSQVSNYEFIDIPLQEVSEIRMKYDGIQTYSFEELEFLKEKFFEKLDGFEIEIFELSEDETIYLLNDSLPILFYKKRLTNSWKEWLNIPFVDQEKNEKTEYLEAKIVELLPNEINFYYNHAQFIREIKEYPLFRDLWETDLFRHSFKGFTFIEREVYNNRKTIDELDEMVPKLELRQRYEEWLGYKDRFVCLEFELPNQEITQVLIHCYKEPTEVIRLFANSLIKNEKFIDRTGIGYRVIHCIDVNKIDEKRQTVKVTTANEVNFMLSRFKGMDMTEILEKNLKYFFTEFHYKEDVYNGDRDRHLLELLSSNWHKKFASLERQQFKKTAAKWVSEYSLYNIVKKEFKDYKVIYQHHPRFLKSSIGGQMSYDIYISKLRIAIEYQGKQHFEPVEFFGGKEGFEKTIRRDKEKLRISNEHGIKIIYYNYWEKVSKKTLLEKLSPFIQD